MRVPTARPSDPSSPQTPLVPIKRHAQPKALDYVVFLLLPWAVFTLLLGLFAVALPDFGPLVWALVAASALLGLLFVSMGCTNGKAAQLALGLLIVTSVSAAVMVGERLQTLHMSEYWHIDSGAEYRGVSPAGPGASYADATAIEFEQGSYVDVKHALGFMKLGDLYCVAPILSGPRTSEEEGSSSTPQFYAAGENCCSERGNFECGDISVAGAHSGVVLDDRAGIFAAAVRMASSVHGLPAPRGAPMFVRWTASPAGFKEALWSKATSEGVTACIVHFVGCVAAAIMLHRGLSR